VEAPFAVAVIVTGVVAVTLPAVAGKVAVVLPAATVTEAGTARAVLLSEMETVKPPVGAALFKPRVQVVAAPDTTVAGEQLSVEGTAGAMRLREALAVVLFRVAVSTAVLSAVTVPTDAVKLALDAPASTVTDAGIVAMALSSAKVTTVPPVGAAPVSATVHVADPPEFRVAGVQVRELRVKVIVSWIDADWELPFNAAVTIAVCVAEIVPAVALNVREVAPAETVIDVGTDRIALSSEMVTRLPPTGAALLSVTLQIEVPPEGSPLGLQTTDDT
jgi:hypothetical protein